MSVANEAFIKLSQALDQCDAIVIGAGSGLSASAGLTYDGQRFTQHFQDFIDTYHLKDMYTAGFYPFPSLEEYWAYWSRHIYYNRYVDPPKNTYQLLKKLVGDKDYYVITTNVDHQFQRAGFHSDNLFCVQGDYGLWQCSKPCHDGVYENETVVYQMLERQKDMKIPSELIPLCPVCGAPMSMHLRTDNTFVEPKEWQDAYHRYERFLEKYRHKAVLFLELGVGYNTPGIIKYPFWNAVMRNPQAWYACLNAYAECPDEIAAQSILCSEDIHDVLKELVGGVRT